MQVKCPQCNIKHPYDTAKPYRPFCSERCKLIDLGAWASDSYSIAGAASADNLDLDLDTENEPRQH